ncbi:NACHT domain-containing protein [Streptomyces sp. SBT349]|uniref:NACHT domain-containing protein n=1 Tax=Streptomyces sp. SBT349 TaxID=1580539 RepID=UPI00069E18D8|nr:NACHT domain-containing protein [Streptomyces sp. SBT349]
MDAGFVAGRLASAVAGPLVRKLFVREGPGAGLAPGATRISSLVSFRGEKRTLTRTDLEKLAAELVRRVITAAGERPIDESEEVAVAFAVANTLHGLGDIDMADVQAVALGHLALARNLKNTQPGATRALSANAAMLYDTVVETACLHILHFFTQRSTFVARTVLEQSRVLSETVARVDQLLERSRSPFAQDTEFETRYRAYIARKYGMLMIYGIDLSNSVDQWPLGTAYMSLQAAVGGRSAQPPIRVEDAFAGGSRILLRGVAGSGKTTLVQWLAVTTAQQDPKVLRAGGTSLAPLVGRIPIVLPIRTLTRRDKELPAPDEFLPHSNNPLAGAQPTGWVDRVLQANRALILIDGIDEAPEAVRGRARTWLQELLSTYSGNLWLVTSRPSAVRDGWLRSMEFSELSLASMGRSDVTAFIRRWHKAARSVAHPDDVEQLNTYESSLITAVRTKHDLGRLATNPLMCGLICALHCDRRGYLPNARKELYSAALSMLLSRRDRERDIRAPDGIELSEEPKIRLLQRLAYKFILNGKAELDRRHAEKIIADALPGVPIAAAQGDAPEIFQHLLLRSGLLREPSEGTIDFIHRTFQDYLGAKAAVEEGDTALLLLRAQEPQWEDVVRMAVAHARPKECAEFLLELVRSGDTALSESRRKHLHLLAVAALEYATELDPSVRAEVKRCVRALIPPQTSAEVSELVAFGAMVLEQLPGPDFLSDSEARRTVETAVLIGGDAAIPLLARYQRLPERRVRQFLASSWHRFATRAYAEGVLAGLDDDGVYFRVTTQDQLAALRDLGERARVRVGDGLPTVALIQALCGDVLTELSVPADQSATWEWLRHASRLHTLTLERADAPLDVSTLAGHAALRLLRLHPRQTVTGLEALSSRRDLEVVYDARPERWQA